MDERLKGRIILIGKEPGQGRLVVSVSGVSKVASLGTIGSVPNCVSRWKDGTAHCQIAISHDGLMTIKNLKDANVTYVNGTPVVSKRVEVNSQVELGKDRYAISINMILQAAATLLPKVAPPPQEYSIRHLKLIWENYEQSIVDLQLEQQNKANQQRLQGILSQLGMLCLIIPSVIPQIPIPNLLRGVFIVAAITMSVFLYIRGKKPEELYVIKQKKLNEKLEKNYVCPKCGHYLEGRKYSLLLQDGKCRNCLAKFKE